MMKSKNLDWCNGDLMRYIHRYCTKKMTVIDIDCCQYKKMSDGREKIRLVESKHEKEKLSKMQEIVLRKFAEYFKHLNSVSKNTDFDVLVIHANTDENDNIDKATIESYVHDIKNTLYGDQVKKFLELEFDLEKIHIPKEQS